MNYDKDGRFVAHAGSEHTLRFPAPAIFLSARLSKPLPVTAIRNNNRRVFNHVPASPLDKPRSAYKLKIESVVTAGQSSFRRSRCSALPADQTPVSVKE